MSIHSDLMHSATDVLVAVQGDAAAVMYLPAAGEAFTWVGACIGVEKGGYQETDEGDVLKCTRLMVQGPTAALVANNVTELERDAVITANGRTDWTIDLPESTWGPSLVRMGLIRRPISRHEEMEGGATPR